MTLMVNTTLMIYLAPTIPTHILSVRSLTYRGIIVCLNKDTMTLKNLQSGQLITSCPIKEDGLYHLQLSFTLTALEDHCNNLLPPSKTGSFYPDPDSPNSSYTALFFSGATNHFMCSKELFSHYLPTTCEQKEIFHTAGGKIQPSGKRWHPTLGICYFLPTLPINILPASQLTKRNCEISFTHYATTIKKYGLDNQLKELNFLSTTGLFRIDLKEIVEFLKNMNHKRIAPSTTTFTDNNNSNFSIATSNKFLCLKTRNCEEHKPTTRSRVYP